MDKIKNNTWGVLALIVLVIIVAVVSNSEGYERGYSKSQEEFQQYKDDNYIYYNEWVNEKGKNLSSEYITYRHTVFDAYRKEDYYYGIDFRNYKEDVGFGLWYNIDRGVCGLRVIDLVSENYDSTEYKLEGVDNGN